MLSEYENILLEVAQKQPGQLCITSTKYLSEAESLEKNGLINIESIFGDIIFYSFPIVTYH